MNHKQNGQWLHYSLARLSPDVFSHPVWVHFTGTNDPFPPKLIDEFLHAAEQLKLQGDLTGAGQTWLICAALQNRLGDNPAALTSTGQARTLAERFDLPQLAWWADWGASSLCVQQGHYQAAAAHLQRLQVGLNEHGSWILSIIVAMIRQDLLKQAIVSTDNGSSLTPPPGSALSAALDWLLRWGEPPPTIEASPHESASNVLDNGHSAAHRWSSPISIQSWRSLWGSVKRLVRGQPRLNGGEPNGPSTPWPPTAVQANGNQPAGPRPSRPSNQPAPSEILAGKAKKGPPLAVHCLGRFRVYSNAQLIEKWSGNKCKSILKYLISHREGPIHREILMDLFWPDVDPEAARRSLYQAIYVLRQALQTGKPNFDYLLCEDSAYRLNPEIDLWIDSEAFGLHYQTGQQLERQGRLTEAISEYEAADSLYEGDFLAEDIYEEWSLAHREHLKHAHLDILDRLSQYYFERGQLATCIAFCQKTLAKDHCHEDAHQRLMRCYLRQGQRHLALRQYHLCVETLAQELDVPPLSATIELYHQIQKNGAQISSL